MESDSVRFKAFLEEVNRINALVEQANALHSEMVVQKGLFMSASSLLGAEASVSAVKEISRKFQRVLDSIEQQVEVLQKSGAQERSTTEYIHLAHIKGIIERAQRILLAFRREEAEILKKQKEQLVEQYAIANPSATEKELSLLNDIERGKALIKQAFSLGKKQETVQAAERRRNSVVTILEDLHALNNVSDRLHRCIARAEESINTISYSVHSMSHRSSLANDHLISGIKYQKRRRNTKRVLYLALFLFCFALSLYLLKLIYPILKALLG